MDDVVFREHMLAWLKAIGDALVDQSRAIESLALALCKQGRQGTLRVKIEAPTSRLRAKRRRLKKAVANGQEVR
jgi:hypothetical protein